MENKKIPPTLTAHDFEMFVDVARESFLILDKNLRVVMANPTFYKNFGVTPKQTENVLLYNLGNGQWDIPELRRLLEEVLPEKKVVKDYEVEHVFQTIGSKTILLNARRIDTSQLIIIAMEDITIKKKLEKDLSLYTSKLADKVKEKTAKLTTKIKELHRLNMNMVGRELKMVELKKEIESLKKQVENCKVNHKTD